MREKGNIISPGLDRYWLGRDSARGGRSRYSLASEAVHDISEDDASGPPDCSGE